MAEVDSLKTSFQVKRPSFWEDRLLNGPSAWLLTSPRMLTGIVAEIVYRNSDHEPRV